MRKEGGKKKEKRKIEEGSCRLRRKSGAGIDARG